MNKIDRWKFGIDNDKLIDLVLKGEKTATTSLYSAYNDQNIPKKGDRSIIVYDNGKDACMIENTDVIITEFRNINEKLAFLEGEGDKSLEYYRKMHIEYFKNIDKNFNDNTKVVFEVLEIIEKEIRNNYEI